MTVEAEVWNAYAESKAKRSPSPDTVQSFRWTQYPGHGPTEAVLGDPKTALEVGFGSGDNAAYLARQGVDVTGVDLSPVAVKNVLDRWGGCGARFIETEAVEYLTKSEERWDAIYSVFGAVWFTDPRELLPLLRDHLNPGGVLAFAHPPAIDGCYGPQGMYKGGFAGPRQFLRRYCYTPEMWRGILLHTGFMDIEASVIEAPEPGHIGTLLVRARITR
ncbi:class I SAM-dependent methyltransferase [Streptomyces sp. NPDC050617]|uniref:class I SAM-dependent methyltransferase n=1 Tax=Streptomyces sp. NPDC050617 TaxID=3154628 RepID=UPI003413B067